MIAILILIGLAIIVAVYVLAHKMYYEWGLALVMGTLANSIVMIFYGSLICLPVLNISGGYMPDYSTGYRDGCIYKVSEKGAIFKTIECEMQLGGQMLPMSTPFCFSIPKTDTNLITQINDSVRKTVRVHYKEYLITDYRISESGYVVTKIEEIKEKE